VKRLTQEDYVKDCERIHNNRYDYSLVEYFKVRSKINIICKQHGVFEQIAKNHKDGQMNLTWGTFMKGSVNDAKRF
jgi:hypothetical protein